MSTAFCPKLSRSLNLRAVLLTLFKPVRSPLLLALLVAFLTFFEVHALGQQRVNIYEGAAPGSLGQHKDIDNPYLLVFLPPHPVDTPAIIICPGGAYSHLSMKFEGTNVAQYWQSHGVAAMVLRYRLPGEDYLYPSPMDDGKRALRLVRSKAAEWHIDATKVGIMGFSAGGHLASTLETHFDGGDPKAADPVERLSCRPDFAVLVYPLITFKKEAATYGLAIALLGPKPDPPVLDLLSNETQVTPQTPPTVIVRAADDKTLTPMNGDLMLAALKKAGVPSALQQYPSGGHGFGYNFGGPTDRSPPGWLDAVDKWLIDQKLLQPPPVPGN